MKVESLTIENFRGIEKLNLKFSPNEPTVLIGINGSGKSSILDCLAIFLSWITFQIRNEIYPSFANLSWATASTIGFSEGSPYFINTRRFSKHDPRNKNKSIEAKIGILYQSQHEILSLSSNVSTNHKRINDRDVYFRKIINSFRKKDLINIPLFVYYPVNRVVFDTPLEIPDEENMKELYYAYKDAVEKEKCDGKQSNLEEETEIENKSMHCGHKKDEWYDEKLLISPLDRHCEDYFYYTEDGQILAVEESDRKVAAETTIDRLGLDIDKLRETRKKAIEDILENVLDPDCLNLEQIKTLVRGFSQTNEKGEYAEFYGAIAYILKKYLTIF